MNTVMKQAIELIPNIHDCHPVPAGAVIAVGTPFWAVSKHGSAIWNVHSYSDSDSEDIVVPHCDSTAWLTLEPIEVAE